MFSELQRAEVIDWWEAERLRVVETCRLARNSEIEMIDKELAQMGVKDILLPRSRARRHVERQLQSDVNMLRKRLAKSLQESFEASFTKIEGSSAILRHASGEVAALTGGAIGNVVVAGLAVSASGVATSTVTTFIFFTSTIFSWPTYLAALGATAIVVAASPFSPTKASAAVVRSRFRKQLVKLVDHAIAGENGSSAENCTVDIFLKQLDEARRVRLEKIL